MDKPYSILYVDDEQGNLNAFRNAFRRDYRVLLAQSAAEGLQILENEHVDLVLTDQRMPQMTGVEFLKSVIKRHPEPNRILVTAYSDFDAIESAINEASIFRYVKKPWDPEQFKRSIDQALELSEMRRRNQQLTRELQQKCDELAAAAHTLAESDQLKYDFLKIISHEIRTPLNGLKGATQLFRIQLAPQPNTDTATIFDVLETSTTRLEDFLLLAERITNLKARQYSLDCLPVDLAKLLQHALREVDAEIRSNRQTLVTELCDDNIIEADAQILSICLKELIHNASVHSQPDSTITIRTQRVEEDLSIEISDQGEGFPDPVLRNLFQIFVRDPQSQEQGLGLNLALTKLVMDLHGGQAEAYNNPHGGATVRLLLRHSEAAAAVRV